MGYVTCSIIFDTKYKKNVYVYGHRCSRKPDLISCMRTTKVQTNLRIRTVWSGAFRCCCIIVGHAKGQILLFLLVFVAEHTGLNLTLVVFVLEID